MSKRRSIHILSGQFLHFLALSLLLAITWYGWRYIGSPYPLLFWSTVGVPIVHQIFVWIAWRKEISKSLGFKTYQVIFFILLAARPVVHTILAWADQDSLGLNDISRIILAIILFIPGIYTMYSVKKYFGLLGASGADHFDPKYRNMPLVKKGVFKYSGNAMYVYGFLLFWSIAIALDSKAALLTSAFGHAYIWVHYYATEKPDMDYLYRTNSP